HTLNSLCWTVRSRVSEVFAFADNLDTQVDVNSSINIRFENGVLAAVVVGGNCAHSGAHMCYMFDGGKIEICPWSGNWINIYDGDEKVKYPAITGAPMDPGDNFIDAILGRDAPRTSPRDGIIQSELMDAIYESVETGRPAKPKR
ncbi:MAG: hypothetical protein CMJ18_16710, partial [Phycisphaeraceae bacterium]|nr:hypothetical protein [Phycisphaeraceae bacterium]